MNLLDAIADAKNLSYDSALLANDILARLEGRKEGDALGDWLDARLLANWLEELTNALYTIQSSLSDVM